jgi:hypothetical protein
VTSKPGYYDTIVPAGLPPLTRHQFHMALIGDPYERAAYAADGRTRVRYVIAAAFEQRAKERRAEGRPDVAGRLTWAEGRIRTGQPLTKRVLTALRKDIEVVQERLCR